MRAFAKRFIQVVFALALVFLFGAGKSELSVAHLSAPMRAVQISVITTSSWSELRSWFSRLKSAGVDTVIIRVFKNSYDGHHKICQPNCDVGVYFKSNYLPCVCDILFQLCALAHQSGLKIYAWMTTRRADYGIKNQPELYSRYYDLKSQSLKISPRLSIFHPQVQVRLKAIFKELARYPIDGILIQDDLMLYYNEDFNPVAISLYYAERSAYALPERFYLEIKRLNGRARVVKYSDEFWHWSKWKAEKLAQFAFELKKAVKEINPRIKVGMNLYYETAQAPKNALAWFAQDLEVLGQYPLDFYCLMLYHRQMQNELGLNSFQLKEVLFRSASYFFQMTPASSEPVIKLMLRDFETANPISLEELQDVLEHLPFNSKAGLAFFPAFRTCERKLPILFQAWEKKR